MITILRRVKETVNNHRPVKSAVSVGFYLLILFLVYSIGYKVLENKHLSDGLWSAWQTFTTVGYGDNPASTKYGRYFSMVFGTIGIAVMAVAISIATDIKQYFKDQKRFGFMENKNKDGYTIINWPGAISASRIIEQIRLDEPYASICFVDSKIEELPQSIQSINNVHFIRGQLSNIETLVRGGINYAKAIIVFPSEPEDPNADLMTCSLVNIVCDHILNPEIRVLYLLCDSKNKWMFKKEATPIMKNSWILNMVQEVQDENSSLYINALLDNADGQSIKSWVCPRQIEVGELRKIFDTVATVIGFRGMRDQEVHLSIWEKEIIYPWDTVFLACENNLSDEKLNELINA